MSDETMTNYEDTARRIAKSHVFGKLQFIAKQEVMATNGTVMKVVIQKLGMHHSDERAILFWNKKGKKIVEKTINCHRQAVMGIVKKCFIGRLAC